MKRSHVVVAVLTAAAVGGTAYSMMPSETCRRTDGGAPLDPASPACRSGSGGTSAGYHSSRAFFGGSASGGSHPSGGSGAGSSSTSAGTAHGGFGGSAGAFGGGHGS
jgi:hypothetical protein